MKHLKKIFKILVLSLALLVLAVVLLFGYSDIPLDELKSRYTNEASAFVDVDGMQVHYRDEGPKSDSIPIVLIHGTGSSLHTFDDWTTDLKSKHRVIRMDLPGYGLTGPFPNRDYSMESYIDFIHDFLNAMNVDSCILGGNSLGGGISWRFTLEHPDTVDKLILIDASGYPVKAQSRPIAFQLAEIPIIKQIFTYITPRSVAKSSIENVYADKSKVTEPLVDRYFELTLREGNRQAFVDRLAVDHQSDEYLNIPNIQQPTLILWGEKDELIPVAMAQNFYKDIPNNTLLILKNVGHVPMEEAPDESLEAVLLFLD
ncbi:alpha/beta fold hydrolase [Winogradskyella aurantiaca]|uniref:alpha/beta fold hydrolase n=1 Tax=Winogradskyella aurantiaca TaxID=2219558 RepID=UPI000E1DDC85|nr:alpha/beta hydrolase [Winogradskyella aurantiaca]